MQPFFPAGPRKCPICLRAPRRHDPMDRVFVPLGFKVPTGMYQACWDCAKEIEPGFRAPLEIPFPPPSNPHRLTDDMNYCLFYCAICKTYCRENEQPEAIRLLPEDIKGCGALPLFDDVSDADPLTPGCYMACSECRNKYLASIANRISKLCGRCGVTKLERLDASGMALCPKCQSRERTIIPVGTDPLTLSGNLVL